MAAFGDKPKTPWVVQHATRNFILVVVALGVVACFSIVLGGINTANSPEFKATVAARTQIAGTQVVERLWTATPLPTAGPTGTPAPTAIPAPTDTPVPTEDIRLGLSLAGFFQKYDAMTDLQKKNYLPTVQGKSVTWSGRVIDVLGDGKVVVDIAGGLLDSVELEDLSTDVAATINKGATVKFTGVIDKVIDLLGLHIYINQAQIAK